ncbi:TIGR02757 family protein [Riemerella columbina]|uniref:TIGR02757 family protein n=1 Tax=Riemerella columbina TaxID=103810 RepID=UPI0003719AF3|nr:TIGR02757 family protein [Riemerella columbina]
MTSQELKEFLDEKADQYNHPDFIVDDPVQIPHRFSLKQDIEVAGFLAATIAWGNRKSIIKSAENILNIMGNNPYDFVLHHSESDLNSIGDKAIHRTFSAEDFRYFMQRMKLLYTQHDSMEVLFQLQDNETNFYHPIERFRAFFLGKEKHRSHKHVSSPYKNSAAKRLMMFLRWMVRQDQRGVDFGIWENIEPRYLSIPLDVHTGNMARKLGILQRKQNDWKTVEELDQTIRLWNPNDPAIYDFALFGLGVSGDLS